MVVAVGLGQVQAAEEWCFNAAHDSCEVLLHVRDACSGKTGKLWLRRLGKEARRDVVMLLQNGANWR